MITIMVYFNKFELVIVFFNSYFKSLIVTYMSLLYLQILNSLLQLLHTMYTKLTGDL